MSAFFHNIFISIYMCVRAIYTRVHDNWLQRYKIYFIFANFTLQNGVFCQFVAYFRQFVAYIHKKSGYPFVDYRFKCYCSQVTNLLLLLSVLFLCPRYQK